MNTDGITLFTNAHTDACAHSVVQSIAELRGKCALIYATGLGKDIYNHMPTLTNEFVFILASLKHKQIGQLSHA